MQIASAKCSMNLSISTCINVIDVVVEANEIIERTKRHQASLTINKQSNNLVSCYKKIHEVSIIKIYVDEISEGRL